MIKIDNEHIVAIDVDQTLFMHEEGIINNDVIVNPYSKTKIGGHLNQNHYELLKQYKARGLFVIVWSKAGVLWAEAVIKHYKLEPYVDLITTKFDRYVDDLEAKDILGERVYIK